MALERYRKKRVQNSSKVSIAPSTCFARVCSFDFSEGAMPWADNHIDPTHMSNPYAATVNEGTIEKGAVCEPPLLYLTDSRID